MHGEEVAHCTRQCALADNGRCTLQVCRCGWNHQFTIMVTTPLPESSSSSWQLMSVRASSLNLRLLRSRLGASRRCCKHPHQGLDEGEAFAEVREQRVLVVGMVDLHAPKADDVEVEPGVLQLLRCGPSDENNEGPSRTGKDYHEGRVRTGEGSTRRHIRKRCQIRVWS